MFIIWSACCGDGAGDTKPIAVNTSYIACVCPNQLSDRTNVFLTGDTEPIVVKGMFQDVVNDLLLVAGANDIKTR